MVMVFGGGCGGRDGDGGGWVMERGSREMEQREEWRKSGKNKEEGMKKEAVGNDKIMGSCKIIYTGCFITNTFKTYQSGSENIDLFNKQTLFIILQSQDVIETDYISNMCTKHFFMIL